MKPENLTTVHPEYKTVKINPYVHKKAAIEAREKDLKLSEYINILLAQALGIVDDKPEPVLDTAA